MANIGDLFFTLGLDDAKLIPDAEKLGKKAGETAGASAGKSMGEKVKGGLGLGFKAAAGVVAAGFGIATAEGIKLNSTLNTLQAETGATGSDWEAMQKVVRRENGRTTESLDDIAAATKVMRQDLGLTGAEIDKYSDKIFDAGLATHQSGAEIAATLDDIGDAYKVNVDRSLALIDQLIASEQKYGGSVRDREAAIAGGAPAAAKLNATLDTQVALLNLAASSGLSAADEQGALNAAAKAFKLPPDLNKLFGGKKATATTPVAAVNKDLKALEAELSRITPPNAYSAFLKEIQAGKTPYDQLVTAQRIYSEQVAKFNADPITAYLDILKEIPDDQARAAKAADLGLGKAAPTFAAFAKTLRDQDKTLQDYSISAGEAGDRIGTIVNQLNKDPGRALQLAVEQFNASLADLGSNPVITGAASLGTIVGGFAPNFGPKLFGVLAGGVKGIGRRFAAVLGVELGSKVVADTAAKAVGGALSEGVSEAAGEAAGATAAKGLGAKMAGFLTRVLGGLKIAVPITIALVATFELVQTFEQVKGQIQAQTNAVAAQTAAFAETATLDALKKSREGVAAQLSNLSHDPIADALGISARKGLENTLATLDTEIARRSGSAEASGEKLGTAFGAGLDKSFDRAGEGHDALSRNLAAQAPAAEAAGKSVGKAAAKGAGAAAGGAGTAGKKVGNAFKTAMTGAVASAGPALKTTASAAISSVAQGILDKQDEVDAALSAALDFQQHAKTRTQQAAHLVGLLTGDELVSGIHDRRPQVRQAFDQVRQDALERLKTLGVNMNNLGKAGGEELAKALKSKDPDVRAAAERLRATLEGNVKPTTAPVGFKAGGDLAAALASTDPVVRGAALKLKSAIEANTRANTAASGGAAGTDLATALASKDPDVRNAALALKRTIEAHTRANTAPKGAAAAGDLAAGLNGPGARQAIVNAARGLVGFINRLLTISPQVTVNARVTQRPTSNRGGAGVRQHGGPVAASSPYIVGEAGPELFVPRVSGHIVPHGPTAAALAGGGDTYQVNIAQPLREPDPVTYAMRQLRRYGETGLLPTRRKAAV